MGSGENLMIENTVITSMLNRKSVRKYKADKPSDEVVETIVRAGQQAPFASQSYSILLTRKKKAPFGAPLWFIICVDLHKLESFMKVRDWEIVTNDVTLLLFGLQDAAYAAENMVIAAESLGLGSCYLGVMPERVTQIVKQYKLPQRVFPLVELVMGYPDEVFPPRPRYPLSFTLFEDQYPEFTEAQVKDAMQVMDEGYMAQGYYAKQKAKIRLEGKRKETFTYDDYSWTEHISRKWGQWFTSPNKMLDALKKQGFDLQFKDTDGKDKSK
jgi:FMN reductase (NADPH)